MIIFKQILKKIIRIVEYMVVYLVVMGMQIAFFALIYSNYKISSPLNASINTF